MEAWEKKVERMENNPRRKAKESRTREYYERQFPEIRKQREQQERFQRSVLPLTHTGFFALPEPFQEMLKTGVDLCFVDKQSLRSSHTQRHMSSFAVM